MKIHALSALINWPGQSKRSIRAGLAGLSFAFLAASAAAQYPVRPITVVVPIAPGGGTDIFARVMSAELSERLKQPVVVENRPGAGNIIGIRNVVSAPPDGYRLLFTSNTVAIDQSVKKKPEFDVMRDLSPIANVVNGVYVLVVSTAVPATTMAEFVAWSKANPGKVNYGSPGLATTGHLITEEFARLAGINIVHVPYTGVAPATTALMAGDIHMIWNDALLSMPAVQAGKARFLAVASNKRSPILPDVPTVAEAGYPSFQAPLKFGFYAPANTPRPIIDKLNAEIQGALNSPRVQEAANKRGWILAGNSPGDFSKMLTDEIAFWARVVREAKIEKQ